MNAIITREASNATFASAELWLTRLRHRREFLFANRQLFLDEAEIPDWGDVRCRLCSAMIETRCSKILQECQNVSTEEDLCQPELILIQALALAGPKHPREDVICHIPDV
jgi:hypothetical protein